MKPTYQFRFRKDSSTYYSADDAGHVGTSPVAVVTEGAIVDWQKLQLQWKRHSFYHGVMREFSPEAVKIAQQGAAICRYIFNTQGDMEAVAELEVYKLRTSNQEYYLRAVCAIDFSKYQNEKLFVSVALMQGGLSAKLQAYDTIDFTIPIGDPSSDPDSDLLWLSGDPGVDPGGLMLLGQYNYQTQKDGGADITLTDTPARPYQEMATGMVYVNMEGEYTVGVTNSPLTGAAVDTWSGGVLTNMYVLKAIRDFSGTASGAFNFATIANLPGSTQNLTLSVRAKVLRGESLSSATVVSDTLIWTDPAGAIIPGAFSPTLSTALLSHSITMVTGDMLVYVFRATAATSQAPGTVSLLEVTLDSQPVDWSINFEYRQDDTPCRVLSHYNLFKKLFHKLTESTAVNPVSDLLTTDVYPGPEVYNLNPKNTFFTCGDALRQLYLSTDGSSAADPSIKTNIRAFAMDALVSLCAGIGIERDGSGNEILRLEHLSHFYQKDVLIADLGSKISKFRMSRFTEYLGNQIKAGYPTQTYDEVNGRFEFNVENIYKTPITRVRRETDSKSVYHTGCYDAEYVRANLANKKTTDSSNDNETFKFQSSGNRLEIAGLTPDPLQMDRAQTVTAGLPASVWPTVYNIPLSPARNMRRLLPWLKSLFYNIPSPVLKFETGTKNKYLESSMYTGPTVTENADIDLTPDGTGEDIIFKPWVFEFEAEVPIDLPDLMESNPYGVFRFTFIRAGVSYELDGFVLECGITDATNDIYNFKLLCSPNTVVPEGL